MHEVALAQSIVDIVTNLALSEHFPRARVVHVELGALSNVMPEALAFGFQAASVGTPAEGAQLDLVVRPGSAWCMDCSVEVDVASRIAVCPQCGGSQTMVTAGEQMRVIDLEVD